MFNLILIVAAIVLVATGFTFHTLRFTRPVSKHITVLKRLGDVVNYGDGKFIITERFGSRKERFEGWDVTDKVTSLGVKTVPDTPVAFFPKIKVRELGYTYAHTEHENVLVAMWSSHTVAVEVPIVGDVEGNFKAAAERALKDIRAKYDKWLQTEKAREFAKAESEKVRDFASQMVVIGDKEEWKDD